MFVDAVAEQLAERIEGRLADLLAARHDRMPRLLDRRGLAAALGCGVDTIDRLRDEGLPTLTVGDSPRFDLEGQVLPWLRERGTG